MSKGLIVGIIIFSIIVIGGSYFLVSGDQKSASAIASYSVSDKARPKAEVKTTYYVLGKMKVSDEKSTEFTIKNSGQKPLQLSGISSSCNCTFAQVIIEGKESDLFGMHNVSEFAGEILPGKSGKIKVIYRPYIMPVYGPIEREVYVTTNDPENEKLVFKVKAIVN
ncbi:DUF1573 domain-containing protein [Candidatus Roizmanbacteria bacterium]|nr:DUF1573 domain-containing protein [Candidatus Roizmanbacteria bacterium]